MHACCHLMQTSRSPTSRRGMSAAAQQHHRLPLQLWQQRLTRQSRWQLAQQQPKAMPQRT